MLPMTSPARSDRPREPITTIAAFDSFATSRMTGGTTEDGAVQLTAGARTGVLQPSNRLVKQLGRRVNFPLPWLRSDRFPVAESDPDLWRHPERVLDRAVLDNGKQSCPPLRQESLRQRHPHVDSVHSGWRLPTHVEVAVHAKPVGSQPVPNEESLSVETHACGQPGDEKLRGRRSDVVSARLLGLVHHQVVVLDLDQEPVASCVSNLDVRHISLRFQMNNVIAS